MLEAFVLAFRQLRDRSLLAIFAKSLAVTLAIFAALGVGLYFALDAALARYAGAPPAGLAGILAAMAGIALFWLTFRAVAIGVIGLFGDEVVAAVERRNYPEAMAGARPVPFARALTMSLRSVIRLIGYNALATPLYLVAAATGIGLPITFFAINGWLLGRDLGDMVAVRHIAPSELEGWRARTRWRRLAMGLAASGLFVVPVINLIAPIVGAAAMTHLFHRGRDVKKTMP